MALSFYSYDLLTPAKFIGLDNFKALRHDELLLKSLGNTFIFAFASVVTHLVGGLLLALAVNRGVNKVLSYFVRTAIFFPFLISWAAVALLWKYVLDPTFGIFSYYLGVIGITAPDWFTDPAWALPSIIGIDFWHTIGYTFLIMLAGLQTVPAGDDRGGAWWTGPAACRPSVYVTLPLMTPTHVLRLGDHLHRCLPDLRPDADHHPGRAERLDHHGRHVPLPDRLPGLHRSATPSTIALVVFAVIMLVTLLQFWGSRKWVHNA